MAAWIIIFSQKKKKNHITSDLIIAVMGKEIFKS